MTKGIILNITKDLKKVLLDVQDPNHWYDLAEWIKTNYVKRGECEYKLDQNNPKLITFIKCTGNAPNTQQYPPQNQPPQQNIQSYPEQPIEVVDMSKPTQIIPENQVTPLPPKENYWDVKTQRDIKVQGDIKKQFFLREGLRAIEIIRQNPTEDEGNVKLTTISLVSYAKMIKDAFKLLD